MAKTKEDSSVPEWRFLLVTDKNMKQEGRCLTFFFRKNGTNKEIKDLLKALFEEMKEEMGYVKGFSAKRIAPFFKVFSQDRYMYHIEGILDFTKESLRKNVQEMGTTSYMQVVCDKYDKNGYPLVREVKL